MDPEFTPIESQEPGTLAWLLQRSYAELLASDSEHWHGEPAAWSAFDRDVFDHPATIGRCVFLSWWDRTLVGFASYDPRPGPAYGIIGHNCVLPAWRGRGFGRRQIREVLRQFHARGIVAAHVTTLDHPFFIPAQRMYLGCGFHELGRHPLATDPARQEIEYGRPVAVSPCG